MCNNIKMNDNNTNCFYKYNVICLHRQIVNLKQKCCLYPYLLLTVIISWRFATKKIVFGVVLEFDASRQTVLSRCVKEWTWWKVPVILNIEVARQVDAAIVFNHKATKRVHFCRITKPGIQRRRYLNITNSFLTVLVWCLIDLPDTQMIISKSLAVLFMALCQKWYL